MLIKIHEYDEDLVNGSRAVFYSYRDIRDAIASQQRKFGGEPSLEWADHFVELHEQWMQVAHFAMKYESMLADKENVIVQIARTLAGRQILQCDNTNGFMNPAKIVHEIEQLSYDAAGDKNDDYHEINLFHKGHITDGRYGAWDEYLNADLTARVTEKYGWWFEKYGYAV